MTLIRFVQRAGILAGITFAGVAFHGGSATAQTEKFCVVASNGKTVCGTLKVVERACVNTDSGVVCGKFKSLASEQGQRKEEARTPLPIAGSRKEANNIVYLLKGCRKSDTSVKCEFVIKNKTAERGLTISGSDSSIVDSTGKSYAGSSIDIGGNNEYARSVSIAPEIDYVAVLNFENIPAQVTKASLLNLFSDGAKIQFRNVPFSN